MPKRILLVEDEMLIRELAAEDLVELGFEVVSAASGDEAAALLDHDCPFDLLFTDIRMPGNVDGVELARMARALRPDLPVIFATGYTDTVIEQASRQRCLPKPYMAQEVLAALTELGFEPT